MTRVAVTGASGRLGRLVVTYLKSAVPADAVFALARSPEKLADLGVVVREADYDRPETLDAALAGIERLLLIASPTLGIRVPQHRRVIEAAKRAGVGYIAYTSVLHADCSLLSLAGEHRETETCLLESGIPFTILRHGWYVENYTAFVPSALEGGAFLGSAGDGRISSATRDDYAEADAIVLAGSGHEGRTYEFAGDEHWTLADLAAEISRQTGRSIPYSDIPEGQFVEFLIDAGLPSELAAAMASWDVAVGQGTLFDDGRELSALIGRPTTPLSAAVSRALEGLV